VTRVGRLLRTYSLDEVPQLFNVIGGSMSLVGPRPHALGTTVDGLPLPAAVPSYSLRYQVRPGMTGLAQVNGARGELNTADKLVRRVEYDLAYIDNWSLGLDLAILFRTLPLVAGDPNAY
jgi:lipopolysaccharide/colanic/teichoic acid biosynthesis glycosyltransferase